MAAQVDVFAYKAAGIDLSKTKHTVVVFLRGSWCPVDRQQLKSLSTVVTRLKTSDLDVQFHAVSNEPGGDGELMRRLANRDAGKISFPVHSDPELKLCTEDRGAGREFMFWVQDIPEKITDIGKSGDYPDYKGVVSNNWVVLDSTGKIVQHESYANYYDGPWDSDLEKLGHSDVPVPEAKDETTWLMMLRPNAEDYAAAITEQRPVKYHKIMGLGSLLADAIVDDVITQNCCCCFLVKKKKYQVTPNDAPDNEETWAKYKSKLG